MTAIPMFPLGSVLVPHMPLALRLFEPRYLTMLAEMIAAERTVFGVVLIERGQEVGGGERRFGVGTIAEITEVGGGDGFVALEAVGGSRFEVLEWLPDAPYPRAEVRMLEPLDGDPASEPRRAATESAVRRALAVASEFEQQQYASVVELSDDPLAACWQLAGIVPSGDLDRQAFLRCASVAELLDAVAARAADAIAQYSA